MFWSQEKPDECALDLVSLRPKTKLDPLSRWIVRECLPVWHAIKETLRSRKNHDEERGVKQQVTGEDNTLESGKEAAGDSPINDGEIAQDVTEPSADDDQQPQREEPDLSSLVSGITSLIY